MDEAKIAAALNEWQRRSIDSPEQFAREFDTQQQFIAERNAGKEPSYGQIAAAYFLKLLAEV